MRRSPFNLPPLRVRPSVHAGLLVAALLFLCVAAPPLPAQEESAAVKSSLEALEKDQRGVEKELRDAIGKARSIRPETPLKAREEIAQRILELRRKLSTLKTEMETQRKKIAAIFDYDWYVVMAEGWGYHAFAPGQQDPVYPRVFDLERKEGHEEWVVKLKRGDGPKAVLEEYRKILGPPVCDRSYRFSEKIPLSPKQPYFWEKLDVTSAGPFQTQADAEKRKREPAWNAVARQNSVDADEVRKRYGCSVRTPQGVTVVDVEGLEWQEAKHKLEELGLKVELRGGDPSKSKPRTVQAQDPKVGATLAPNGTVTLRIHTEYVEPQRPVPDVLGRNWKDAQSELERAGFQVELRGGDPSKDNPGGVQDQDPKYPAMRAPNSTVILRIFSAEVEPPPPAADRPPPPPRVPAEKQRAKELAQRCHSLLQQGDDAYNTGRLEDSLAAYQRAQDLGCPASDLAGAIAGVEEAIAQRNQQAQQQQRQAQQCNALVGRGNDAHGRGNIQGALDAYYQAQNLGCNVPDLDNAIAGLEQQNQQQQDQTGQAQQCAVWLQLGDSARSSGQAEQALNLYQQARNFGCASPQLDRAIADLERGMQQQNQEIQHQQQAQYCNGLVERGRNAANAGRRQEAVDLYNQGSQSGCPVEGIRQAIANLDRAVQPPPSQPRPPARPIQPIRPPGPIHPLPPASGCVDTLLGQEVGAPCPH